MLLLKQNSSIKELINDGNLMALLQQDKGNNREYKVKAISNNTIHDSKSEGYLSTLYYFISRKGYLEQKNT